MSNFYTRLVEKFSEESDPIENLGIGLSSLADMAWGELKKGDLIYIKKHINEDHPQGQLLYIEDINLNLGTFEIKYTKRGVKNPYYHRWVLTFPFANKYLVRIPKKYSHMF